LATEHALPAGYVTDSYAPPMERHVDFLTSYPPGDLWHGQLWGPMKEETVSWLGRIMMGVETPHASAADGHRNLLLSMAMDRSAELGRELALPLDPELLGAE
jgi:myo-inositol 2-dehydrogenase/D-chiro-inositol 1-dehydrogenase